MYIISEKKNCFWVIYLSHTAGHLNWCNKKHRWYFCTAIDWLYRIYQLQNHHSGDIKIIIVFMIKIYNIEHFKKDPKPFKVLHPNCLYMQQYLQMALAVNIY